MHHTNNALATAVGTALLLPLLIILTIFITWIFTLINILKNEFTGQNKIIWIMLSTFTGPIGIILYWTIGQNHIINEIEDNQCPSCNKFMYVKTNPTTKKTFYRCSSCGFTETI